MKFLKAAGVLLLGMIGAVIGIAMFLALIFISPVLAIAVGWITGVFVEWVFGGYLTDGINSLFGTSLASGDLPKITATLWFLGYVIGIRRANVNNNTKNKEGANNDKIKFN